MVEVTVRVCDICKEKIAAGNCPLCDRDVCQQCTKKFSIELGMKWRGPSAELYRKRICTKCAKNIEENSKKIINDLASQTEPKIIDVLSSYIEKKEKVDAEEVEEKREEFKEKWEKEST